MLDRLIEARARTLSLVEPLDDEAVRIQHDPLMSPIVWDLGHIAHFEEVWLIEKAAAGGEGDGREGLRGIYDPFTHPRGERETLPLPSRSEALDYLSRVRQDVVTMLYRFDARTNRPLLHQHYVLNMVLQHEYQHNETILQCLQLKKGAHYTATLSGRPVPGAHGGAVPPWGTMVRFPGGEVLFGTDDRGEAYDNERSQHRVRLDPFWIDAAPVTCGDYLAFMTDGGYERPELWSPTGRAWLAGGEVRSPKYWWKDGDGWFQRVLDRVRAVDQTRPVCHVCYHEAEAYAAWAGKRLPTEFEWEAAASWDPEMGLKRRFPWGNESWRPDIANLDVLCLDTAPVGAYPQNVSPVGCYGMIGDVWEWTSSDFTPYPGFEAFPYPEYSEVFFGSESKVLRGGSWATRPGAIRNTFRNWDFPARRQIFAGLRCARDD